MKQSQKGQPGLPDIRPFKGKSRKTSVRVVVETPKGSRNKYAFDPEFCIFQLSKVLPEGMDFPYDFGFIPSTRAEDGDPVDVVFLMDEPAFPGCVFNARLIGVIEGKQTEKGRWIRNDRLVAVANESHTHSDIKHIDELNAHLLDELERFFENYHQHAGDEYKALGRNGPKRALQHLKKTMRGTKKDRRNAHGQIRPQGV